MNVATSTRKSRMPADDRHRQLLRSAIDCFARNGFGGTKTKDIAAAAGVSEAILFRHFATKEDLYHAILDMKEDQEAANSLKRVIEECAARRDDAGVFSAVAREIFDSFEEDPAFHRLILYALLEGHLMANLFHKRLGSRRRDFMRRYVVQRQSEGAFRVCDPDLALMFSIGTVVHFAMGKHIFGMKKPAIADEAVIKQVVEFILAGLTEPAAPRLRTNKKEKGIHATS
ncbi:MAG TPA: TetR/AcrR family transcriptional regulator [Bryobacteraceae bacterium]|nr:TetR/AcrR family transcriptional regulator [Bryobacteraceae bacterium]